jgi:nitrilase
MPYVTPVRATIVQAAPVIFDREATVEKARGLIREAAAPGADLVLFPEAFIPAYPRGLGFGTKVGCRTMEGRDLWRRYWENAVDIPGPVTGALGKAAREAGVFLSIGVIEREGGTLYCTILYFGPDGAMLGKHRKLMPTGAERLIWGAGDGSTLTVLETPLGRIGGLVCWENYMPAARLALYAKGVEIYLAPTADSRDSWQASMRHIACEGRCFVLGYNQFVTRDMYPDFLRDHPDLRDEPDIMSRGGSVIVNPFGEVIAGPLWDREGILRAELDRREVIRGKMDFDVAGHYSRPDVFQLTVNEKPMAPVRREC